MKPQIVHRYTIPLQTVIEQLIGKEAADGEGFLVAVEDNDLVVDIIEPRPQESQTPAGEKIRSAQGEAMETAPATGQPPVGAVSPTERKGGPLAQRAAIMCGEKGFWRFLAETYNAKGIDSAEAAATLLRAECGVTSRSEIDHNPAAAEIFRPIESRYRMWLEGY
ncbi:MAG: hypothetical protein E5Y01_16025 [Mesorhizobium sp.]|uniref:hypothetical protein n=1 Tax=Mesorhizobium sp. TaxID=1871066 RepID=UPI0012183246|nr:hypothetical protein [Mesorhizobium sp.]TJV51095.1 MAG: hypothetical protein E5Y01_16025 [Mesorhizobium sp.]